jgi:hypothetical protein
MNLTPYIRFGDVDSIQTEKDKAELRGLVKTVVGSIICGKFLPELIKYQLLKKNYSALWSHLVVNIP